MIKVFISVLISLVLLYLTVKQIDLNQALALLKDTNLVLVSLSIAVHFVGYYVRSVRWSVLLSSLTSASPTALFPIVSIGYMANNVLPFRLGELVRIQLVGRSFNINRGSVLSTVVVERMFDGLTLVIFLLIFFIFNPVPANIRLLAYFSAAGLGFVFVFLFALTKARRNESIKKILLKLPVVKIPLVKRLITSLMDGLVLLNSPVILAKAFAISVLNWALEIWMIYLIAVSMGIPVNYFQVVFLTSVINIATIFPSAPGYFGTFEFFTWQALVLFGVEKTQAITFAALVHLIQWAPVTLVGYIYTFKYHLSFKGLKVPQS